MSVGYKLIELMQDAGRGLPQQFGQRKARCQQKLLISPCKMRIGWHSINMHNISGRYI